MNDTDQHKREFWKPGFSLSARPDGESYELKIDKSRIRISFPRERETENETVILIGPIQKTIKQ